MQKCQVDDRSEGFPPRDIWFLHAVLQGSHRMGRVVGTSSPPPSVGFGAITPRTPHPAYPARGRVIRMLVPIPECLVLQYLQIHKSSDGPQNGSSFSISRFAGP